MRDYFRKPEEVGFLQPKKSPEPIPEGGAEEVVRLPGLFSEAELTSKVVGKIIFRFPSTTDVAHKHIFYNRSDVLEAADREAGTSHARSVTNIIEWLDKASAYLDEANRYESNESNAFAIERHLKSARDAFKKAQHISQILGERYYPQLYKKEI